MPSEWSREGGLTRARWRAVLCAGEHPARNPDQNIADLKAQAAAARGASPNCSARRSFMARTPSRLTCATYRTNAEEAVRKVIGALADGAFTVPMDGGDEIRVAITVDRERRSARVDFGGTSAQSDTI